MGVRGLRWLGATRVGRRLGRGWKRLSGPFGRATQPLVAGS